VRGCTYVSIERGGMNIPKNRSARIEHRIS
jgi:hypothetical protein